MIGHAYTDRMSPGKMFYANHTFSPNLDAYQSSRAPDDDPADHLVPQLYKSDTRSNVYQAGFAGRATHTISNNEPGIKFELGDKSVVSDFQVVEDKNSPSRVINFTDEDKEVPLLSTVRDRQNPSAQNLTVYGSEST